MRARYGGFALAALTVACGKESEAGQSYKEGVALLCRSIDEVGEGEPEPLALALVRATEESVARWLATAGYSASRRRCGAS